MYKFVLSLLLTFCVFSLIADGVQPIGTGTENDPYQIATLDNLLWFSTNDSSWSSHFIQTADIDASDTESWNDYAGFSPIGNDDTMFTGSYNGNDYVISNLDASELNFVCNLGFFGYIFSATIQNVHLNDATVLSRGWETGILVGLSDTSYINNCSVSGTLDATIHVGGLIGACSETTIENCVVDCEIVCNNLGGGFVGYMRNESILRGCTSSVVIQGSNDLGGLAGRADDSLIENCNSSVSISGTHTLAGLVARVEHSQISNSYTSASISGETKLGILCAIIELHESEVRNSFYDYNDSTINNSAKWLLGAMSSEIYSEWMLNDLTLDIASSFLNDGDYYLISTPGDLRTAIVFAQIDNYAFKLTNDLNLSSIHELFFPYFDGRFDGAGFAVESFSLHYSGYNRVGFFGLSKHARIENLIINDGYVNGRWDCAILTGFDVNSAIYNCKTSGQVYGASNCGGLVGFSIDSNIDYSSFTGTVAASEYVGGLVGKLTTYGSCNNCYTRGEVTGSNYVGGVFGSANGYISFIYSTTLVYGDENTYAIAGISQRSFNSSFWDMEVTGMSGSNYGAIGLTTNDMKDFSTYVGAGWDMLDETINGDDDYWSIDSEVNDGYPHILLADIVSLDESSQPSLDNRLSLNNYPNPFNPTTTISFNVLSNDETNISFYNIRGELVFSHKQNYSVGRNKFTWNGKDTKNRCLASGTYFCRIQNCGDSEVKKLVMIK